MKKSSVKELHTLWKPLTKSRKLSETLVFDIETHKKLFNIFQVGDFYYMIVNVNEVNFDYVSDEIEKILGINPVNFTLADIFGRIHPEDQPYVLSFETAIVNFYANLSATKIPLYKTRYDYRVRKANGEYLRILQQIAIIECDDNGYIYKTLCVHTDISHIKESGKPLFSIIGLEGEPSYINIDVEQKYTASSLLSHREKQVVNLLIEGKISKDIALELGLSSNTVITYRRNILKKTETATTPELIAKVIREGWV